MDAGLILVRSIKRLNEENCIQELSVFSFGFKRATGIGLSVLQSAN